MPERTRWRSRLEGVCLAAFLLWLLWLPLPFGSVTARARTPLILVPLLLCAAAALLRAYVPRTAHHPTAPNRIWSAAAVLLIALAALQLVPLSPSVLQLLSPESHGIWTAAGRIAAHGGATGGTSHPISIDPASTLFELFRLIALFATFQTAVLLVRNHRRRLLLSFALGAAALFEAIYGAREAALGRYTIWGWKNVLVLDRVTGTFVNPNHFANYVAMVLPLMIFIMALAWHEAGPVTVPRGVRLVKIAEQRFVRVAFAAVVSIGCIVAVLLAQSRGGLLSMAAGLSIGALLAGRRTPVKLAFGGLAFVLGLAMLVLVLGRERTVSRFQPLPEEQSTLVGRRTGIETAIGVWRRFPVFGSGAGTFASVSLLEQRENVSKHYRHAHDDYVELGATTGLLGAGIAIPALFFGWFALARMTFGQAAVAELRWRRRAFQWAALVSLSIAIVHALIDYNFFIPSNPATLAAIAGAAAAAYDSDDKRTRR